VRVTGTTVGQRGAPHIGLGTEIAASSEPFRPPAASTVPVTSATTPARRCRRATSSFDRVDPEHVVLGVGDPVT
jgi:hypothetical protein